MHNGSSPGRRVKLGEMILASLRSTGLLPFSSSSCPQESIIETNRSRARMANAWQTHGKAGKGSKRAAAVAASEAISVLPDIESSNGDEVAVSSAGGSSGSRKRSSGAFQSASAGGGGGSGTGGEAVGSPSATGGSKSGSKRQKR